MYALVRNKKGMTLIEAIVAVVILGIMVVPLAGFFTVSSQRARITVVERQALALAEAKIESMRENSFADYQLTDDVDSGQWTWEPGGKFSGMVKTERTYNGIMLLKATVTVSWDGGEVNLSTLVSKHR